jgi:2,4-dienoyl-CoA reductase-like NADH-dependent reductase (Old Yellow Enzyme family)/thioredoxin reductase
VIAPSQTRKVAAVTSSAPNSPYPTLFTPMQLGPKTAKNRIWMTGHSTHLVENAKFSEAHINYYRERARGGLGVITTEALAVHPTTQPYEGARVFAFEPEIVPNYQALATALHEYDVLVFAQLWHRGRQTHGVVSRKPVWAPSAVPCALNREMPHAMTEYEIDEMVEHYVRSAEYAVEGGMDGVEIHGVTHGYLLGQFLSPATNHRTDDYGGSYENRIRIVLRIIDEIKAIAPADFVVGMRISGDEGIEHGLDNAAWVQLARSFADTGKIDYLSVTQGTYLNRMMMYGATPVVPGYQLPATAEIKKAVPELPVTAVGRILTPEMGEQILTSGTADMVCMARQLIADPEWPNKAAEDRADDIRPCVGANWCLASVTRTKLACAHNPAVGREADLGIGSIKRVETPQRVAVVGGGPAGLRAALTSALRGHRVTLFEKADALGGQLNLLRDVAGVREYTGIVDWLIGQLAKTDAEVRLATEATPGTLAEFDAVVVATGSQPLRTGWSSLHPFEWGPGRDSVPGTEQDNVFTIPDVLTGKATMRSALIFDDTGNRNPLVAAEYLAAHKHPVRFVTRMASPGADLLDTRDGASVYARLRRMGVVFDVNAEITQIDGDAVHLRDIHTAEATVVEDVDMVVLSTGNVADDALLRSLEAEKSVRTLAAGDCLAPRRFFNAVWEGEWAGRAT